MVDQRQDTCVNAFLYQKLCASEMQVLGHWGGRQGDFAR
jgi:hypothetical protein